MEPARLIDPSETSELSDLSDESDESAPLESAPAPSDVPPDTNRWLITAGTALVGIAVIAFLTRYNMSGQRFAFNSLNYRTWEEYLLANITGLTLFPFLLIFGGFRQRAEEYGFRPPDAPAAKIALVFFALMIPVLV